MAYTITLSDEEYETLAAEAQRTGESVEALVHAAVRARYAPAQPAERAPSPGTAVDPLVEYMYRAGHLLRIPSGGSELDEEEDELERLAKSVKPGKLASDMVIEDRGPR